MSDGANAEGSEEQRQTGTFIANVVSLHIAYTRCSRIVGVCRKLPNLLDRSLTRSSFSSSIVEPQLKDLILVQTVKWYELGLQLEVKGKDLDVIQANNQNNVEACKREMFSKWLRITPNASYQQVVEALQVVGEISEANRLCKNMTVRYR